MTRDRDRRAALAALARTVWLWYLLAGSSSRSVPVRAGLPARQRHPADHQRPRRLGRRRHPGRHAPAPPEGGRRLGLLAVGQTLFVARRLLHLQPAQPVRLNVGFPSPGDGLYLTVYPALMAGLFVLVRRRNPRTDRAGAIDSLILTLGIALLSWVFLIAPNIQLGGNWLRRGRLDRLPGRRHPAARGGHPARGRPRRRAPAFYLLAGSIVCLLGTDSVYNRMLLDGTYNGQVSSMSGWIFYYLLWGAAALHPSMRTLEQPAEGRRPG